MRVPSGHYFAYSRAVLLRPQTHLAVVVVVVVVVVVAMADYFADYGFVCKSEWSKAGAAATKLMLLLCSPNFTTATITTNNPCNYKGLWRRTSGSLG